MYNLTLISNFFHRQTSNLINALLADLGYSDPADLVSKDKVRSLKIRHGWSLQVTHEETMGYEHIGFDSTKSSVWEAGNQWSRSVDKQTVICQSRRSYIGKYILCIYLQDMVLLSKHKWSLVWFSLVVH